MIAISILLKLLQTPALLIRSVHSSCSAPNSTSVSRVENCHGKNLRRIGTHNLHSAFAFTCLTFTRWFFSIGFSSTAHHPTSNICTYFVSNNQLSISAIFFYRNPWVAVNSDSKAAADIINATWTWYVCLYACIHVYGLSRMTINAFRYIILIIRVQVVLALDSYRRSWQIKYLMWANVLSGHTLFQGSRVMFVENMSTQQSNTNYIGKWS